MIEFYENLIGKRHGWANSLSAVAWNKLGPGETILYVYDNDETPSTKHFQSQTNVWQNSAPISNWHMIGYHVLCYAKTFNNPDSLAKLVLWHSYGLIRNRWGFKSQHRRENVFKFETFFCQLPFGKKFNWEITLLVTVKY